MCRGCMSRCNVQTDSPENSLPTQLFLHFGLRENPFGVTPDIRFLYQSHTHREALVSLINGIDFGFGFQVLIGQPGMGKTSLLFNLLEKFRTSAHTAFLFQPQSEPQDLLQSMLYELGTSSAETSLRKLFEQVNGVLYRAARERKRVILVVDEAQNLEYAVLEALRQLSNFETPDAKLLQVVLAGQPQLAEKLGNPAHEQLRQRISAISRLSPLGLEETEAYIKHRLATAGYGRAELFTEGGVRLIWNRSKGVPRNINTLCFRAMLLGFAEDAKSIDERMLQKADRDLDLNSALADVFEMDATVTAPRSNGSFQLGWNTPPPEKDDTRTDIARTDIARTDDGGAVTSEGLIGSADEIPHQAAVMESARSDDGDMAGASEYVPPAVVEALARITQALEEQRLLLMAKSTAAPPALAIDLLPTMPLSVPAMSVPAKEGAASPANFESIAVVPVPAPIESNIQSNPVAQIAHDQTEKLDTNALLMSFGREVPAASERASSNAPRREDIEQSLVADRPAPPSYAARAKEHSASRMVWTKALSLGAAAGILLVLLFEKSPLPHLWTVKAGVPAQARAQSAAVSDSQQANYSVLDGSSASPIVSPNSVEPGSVSPSHVIPSPADTSAATNPHDRRLHHSDPSPDVIIKTFPTELSVTVKNANNKQELRRIFFNEDSDTVDSQYRPWLQQIADTLANDPTAVVTLEGHTDGLGRESHNMALSSRRAIAVRNALVNELHVPKQRLIATGVGSEAPLQPNSSAEGRAYNRRVEVRLKHSSD
jgi:type II secretory pathway predicted ATPase ExeA/outer membrane protein OmpA-like peptidoglycan-associated protein